MWEFAGKIALGILFQIWRAFVAARIWHWYIAPFFSVRDLSIPYAFGIIMFAYSVIPYNGITADVVAWEKKTTYEKTILAVTTGAVLPAISFAMAWVGTFFR